MSVVTFVSLMVTIYTIGYMQHDDGLSALLQLHLAVHLLDADAGHVEQFSCNCSRLGSVGVVSYLLIGFWYSARRHIANLKAFLANRIGELRLCRYRRRGPIHRVARLCNGVAHADQIAAAQIHISSTVVWPAITFTCICLFVGAMGKSRKCPARVAADSMEGPPRSRR